MVTGLRASLVLAAMLTKKVSDATGLEPRSLTWEGLTSTTMRSPIGADGTGTLM
jgi:hypothetical protein